MICLKVADKDGKNITVAHGETEVYLALNHEYQEGGHYYSGNRGGRTSHMASGR